MFTPWRPQKRVDPAVEFMYHIYETYYDKLTYISFYICHDDAIAEEAIHQVYANVLADIDNMMAKDSIEGYLVTSVRNATKNILKREKNEAKKSAQVISQYLSEPDPAYIVAERELLRQAINTLEETEKEIFSLHCQGYKQKEIAKRMGVSASTISRKLKAIRAILRASIETDPTGDCYAEEYA